MSNTVTNIDINTVGDSNNFSLPTARRTPKLCKSRAQLSVPRSFISASRSISVLLWVHRSMASLPSPSRALPSERSDVSTDGSFETAPNSPEEFFSLPSSPKITQISTPTTPRARKKVSWSPLPPKMDHTPTRSTSTPHLRVGVDQSFPWLPRTLSTDQTDSSLATTTTDQIDSPLATPTQSGRDQGGLFQSFLSQSAAQVLKYAPLSGNPLLPLDICADGFLKTKKFEVICNVAMSIACMIPTDPPPQSFMSLDTTPMHPYFESFVAVFTECFAKRLRDRNSFPLKPATYALDGTVTLEEDHQAFETELVAHVHAIFRSYNTNWALRIFGSYDNLFIDSTQRHAGIAVMAMRESTEKPSYPPRANWKVGESLHAFYKQQLRRFRAGVVRMVEERPECAWLLTVPEQLERGIGGYEQYYIAHVRHKILVHNGEA